LSCHSVPRAIVAIKASWLALEIYAPQAFRRFQVAVLPMFSAWRDSPWADIGGAQSTLTPQGVPFEYVWRSSFEASLNWTADVSGAHVPFQEKPAAAVMFLKAQLGAMPEWLYSWSTPLNQAERFGAWVSGRHTKTHDAYKLYLEWQPSFEKHVPFCLKNNPVKPSLLGVSANGIEVYTRLKDDDWDTLWALARRFEVTETLEATLREYALWRGAPLKTLRGFGLSFASVGKNDTDVSLIAIMKHVLPDAIRRQEVLQNLDPDFPLFQKNKGIPVMLSRSLSQKGVFSVGMQPIF
jgi:hypothetical protein